METEKVLETGLEVVVDNVDYKAVAETLTDCLDKMLNCSMVAEFNYKRGFIVGSVLGVGAAVTIGFVSKKTAKFVARKIEEYKQEN